MQNEETEKNKYKYKIGPIADKVLDDLICYLRRKETSDKIYEQIINPMISNIFSEYYSYFMSVIIILLILIILLIALLIMFIFNTKNK